ncbi:MAG: amino acid permease [Phycisphaerales bacterium]|nr:amino acid permease [Phycisphaerales bacterium]
MTQRTPEKLGLAELIAMGVGGMIGGGIFSVLGIAVGISGHATPLAFALGGLIAMLAGYSYVRLALAYRDDGASFTYLERAFPKHPHVAGVEGWAVIVGYVGTLALYAFTFGAYGADLLGSDNDPMVRLVLSTGVLLFFMVVNLRGVKSSGRTEDLIVYTKIILLAFFAFAGMRSVKSDHLFPVFDTGVSSVFIAGAMVFVAFEGFQLITNAITEIDDPDKNVPRGIYGSIIITTLIYLSVAFVAIGSPTAAELIAAEEYALAVAAEPALGNAGRVLVGVAALLATSSAINATVFGASRMLSQMASERIVPKAFSFRSRVGHAPVVGVITMTALGIAFTTMNSLGTIASFSSLTFLLVSLGVGIANYRLRAITRANPTIVLCGIMVVALTIGLLLSYMWSHDRSTLASIGLIYGVVFVAESAFSKRLSFLRK